MAQRRVPIDLAQIEEIELDFGVYKQGFGAHEDLKRQTVERPAARGRYEATLAEINRHQVSLAEVRKARDLTQKTVADYMDMTQSEVSKFERRCDMYLSTMKRYVGAMGGELHLVASFSNGEAVELLVPQAHDDEEATSI